MFVISSVFLFIVLSLCHGGPTTDRQCTPDTNDFTTKVEKSSIVAYGKAMAKILDEDNDSTFKVFFQVDCILKGPAISRQINIIDAGRVEGKQHCQDLPVGHGYSIVFLEPSSSNTTDYKTFIPADFAEISYEKNSTNELLALTCNLLQIVPRQSSALVNELCPAVSTDPSCHKTVDTAVIMAIDNLMNITSIILSNVTTDLLYNESIVISYEKEHLPDPVHPVSQDLNTIRSKAGTNQVDIDSKNSANSLTSSILIVIIAIFICSR